MKTPRKNDKEPPRTPKAPRGKGRNEYLYAYDTTKIYLGISSSIPHPKLVRRGIPEEILLKTHSILF
jgi:hypothetical protein